MNQVFEEDDPHLVEEDESSEKHGKVIGKHGENHRKTIGKQVTVFMAFHGKHGNEHLGSVSIPNKKKGVGRGTKSPAPQYPFHFILIRSNSLKLSQYFLR